MREPIYYPELFTSVPQGTLIYTKDDELKYTILATRWEHPGPRCTRIKTNGKQCRGTIFSGSRKWALNDDGETIMEPADWDLFLYGACHYHRAAESETGDAK